MGIHIYAHGAKRVKCHDHSGGPYCFESSKLVPKVRTSVATCSRYSCFLQLHETFVQYRTEEKAPLH